MSLINEALKRTRDNSFQAGHARPMTTDSYRVNSQPDALGTRTGVWLTALVVSVVGVAVVLMALRVMRPVGKLQQGLIAADTASPNVGMRWKSAPNFAAPVATVATPAIVEATPAPVSETADAPPPDPPPAPAPEPPKFVLQGVTRTADFREAMINGVNLREGDELEGARVVAIETRRVTLKFGDREIVLRIP